MFEENLEKIAYIREVFCQNSKILKNLEEQINLLNLPAIQIKPEIVKILQFLMKLTNPKKIIEIGTHIGYSAIAMAESLSSDFMIYTIEKNSERAKIARNNFITYNFSDSIKLYEGEAIAVLEDICDDGPFDLILIDANKSQYLEYLQWAEKNVKKNGIILADNVLLHDLVFEKNKKHKFSENNIEKMRLFNQKLNDKEKYVTCFFPTKDGFTISLKLF